MCEPFLLEAPQAFDAALSPSVDLVLLTANDGQGFHVLVVLPP